jgi:hypothetical protein
MRREPNEGQPLELRQIAVRHPLDEHRTRCCAGSAYKDERLQRHVGERIEEGVARQKPLDSELVEVEAVGEGVVERVVVGCRS